MKVKNTVSESSEDGSDDGLSSAEIDRLYKHYKDLNDARILEHLIDLKPELSNLELLKLQLQFDFKKLEFSLKILETHSEQHKLIDDLLKMFDEKELEYNQYSEYWVMRVLH